jgi:RNA polymerase sigma factor (sigma-70 family)
MITPQFINECITGSENAIQALVRAHQRGVFQMALTIIDDGSTPVRDAAAQAELATRDTFIAVLDQLGRYRDEVPFSTFLYRITIMVSRRRARRWRRERFLRAVWQKIGGLKTNSSNLEEVEVLATVGASASESAGMFFEAVRGLNENLRLPVVLRYYHDLPVAEIARLLKLGEGAVHARLDAAREKIAGLPAREAEMADD